MGEQGDVERGVGGQGQIKERGREAAEAQTLRGGRMRTELREGITKLRHQRAKTERGRRSRIGREGKKRRRRKERAKRGNTAWVMCAGVVLHVYKPAAYLALLFLKKVKSRQMLICTLSLKCVLARSFLPITAEL